MKHMYKEMKHLSILILLFSQLFTFTSCVKEEEYANTPTGNFEALWRIMDKHYCFFDLKQKELGVDWNNVHARYASQVSDKMSNEQLFEFLSKMIGELKDGHVNLSASFDYGRNWAWKEDYPANFSDSLQRKYLGTDYRISCGLKYRILDNNVGYIYCGSFENPFGAGNLDEILLHLAPCNSIIIDVRNNGGGMITSAQTLAGRFTNEKTLVGYMQHKTGTAHNSFSDLEAQYIEPAKGIRWQKKVSVLANRSTYSAANEFVKYMKTLGATIIGDTTGGGAGMPFSSELPNGWGVRFSACPMYDSQHNSTEFGIAPTKKVDILSDDYQKWVDTIIETAFF